MATSCISFETKRDIGRKLRFFAALCYKHGLYRRAVSVRPSAMFVYCIKTSNHILKLVSQWDSQTILFFPQ